MLYTRKDSKSYEMEFKKRFTNFCEKSPILLSFTTSASLVQVIDESQDTVYEFPWDYTIDVKEFIHAIKQVLIQNCYPIIIKISKTEIPTTIEEQTKIAQSGVPIDTIPTKKVLLSKKEYLIDKVIIYKDTFILIDKETLEVFRYKLNKSSVFFLKNIRNGKFSKEQAGDFFFDNAELLNKIDTKEV